MLCTIRRKRPSVSAKWSNAMNDTIGRILEITFVAVLVYLVLKNSEGFSTVAGATAGAYSTSVQALQGR
jgi:hypothetical protein